MTIAHWHHSQSHSGVCPLSCSSRAARPAYRGSQQHSRHFASLQRRHRGRSNALVVSAISMPRSWQSFKMKVKYSWVNLQDQFWSLPWIAKAVQAFQQLQQPITKAIMIAVTRFGRWWQDRSNEYDDFCTEENIREWKWRRKNEQEWDIWRRVLIGAVAVLFTMVWETIVPTSMFWALVPPIWMSWTMYDNWFVSPIALGLLIMLPLKFPPYGPWRWI